MTRLVLADDHPFFRSGVRAALIDSGFTIAAYVSDGLEALAGIAEFDPEIVVLDVAMPRMNGIEVLQKMREGGSDTPVVLLTEMLDDDQLVQAIRHDVNGNVFKDGAEERLFESLQAVRDGRRYIDQQLLTRALGCTLKPAARDPLTGIAPRERQIGQ